MLNPLCFNEFKYKTAPPNPTSSTDLFGFGGAVQFIRLISLQLSVIKVIVNNDTSVIDYFAISIG